MAYRSKFAIAIISAAVAFYAIIGVIFGWSSINAQQPINDAGAQVRIFESVLQHIQNDYVDEPDLEKVRNGALRGLANGLDPYSSYLTADQVAAFNDAKKSEKVGIGAVFSQVSSYLYVIAVVKDSPADKAGLKAGDVVEYIETKATRDISLYDAEQMIEGAAGTKVKLRVLRLRDAGKAQPITVERASYALPEPIVEVKDGVAHLKVFSMAKGESAKIKKSLEGIKDKKIKKVVLDLRNVADGDLAEAVETANLFVKSGKLATIVGRESKVIETFTAAPEKQVYEDELVALVDLGTAGTGEVIAAAILENKRGEVVGERTFGAGAVQELFKLSGGDGFLLTKAKWAAPGGTPFLSADRQTRGLKPTVEVQRPETPEPIEVEELIEEKNGDGSDKPAETVKPVPVPKEDIQLKKAFEVINEKAKSAAASG